VRIVADTNTALSGLLWQGPPRRLIDLARERAITLCIEELFGRPAARTAGKRVSAPKLQQQIERIGKLPKAKESFVMGVLETVLTQAAAKERPR
jgi:predicted nucleic acid-binding protein